MKGNALLRQKPIYTTIALYPNMLRYHLSPQELNVTRKFFNKYYNPYFVPSNSMKPSFLRGCPPFRTTLRI